MGLTNKQSSKLFGITKNTTKASLSKYTILFFVTLWISNNALAQRSVDGTYTVPTDETLEQSSEYPVEYKLRRRNGNSTRIKYKLPPELTGETNDVSIEPANDGTNRWVGDHAEGPCDIEGQSFVCNLVYRDLDLNRDLAIQKINQGYPSNSEELSRRINVMDRFMSEPAGITHIPLE